MLRRISVVMTRTRPWGLTFTSPVRMPTTSAPNARVKSPNFWLRSEEHTSELQSQSNLVCRLLLEKKNKAGKLEMIDRIEIRRPIVTGHMPRTVATTQALEV